MNKDDKSFNLILFLCWILPVFAPIVIYAFQPKSFSKRSRFVVCQLLNKQFTMSLVYYALASGLIRNITNTIITYRVMAVMLIILIFSIIIQARYTLKWIRGEYIEYKYILKLFNVW